MSDHPKDWADDVATQIMVVAFTKTYAREVIAEIVRLSYSRGELAGIERASKTVDEYLSRNATGGTQ